ncbi:hypothetical protein H5410_036472, partial [Solanum commersonii]
SRETSAKRHHSQKQTESTTMFLNDAQRQQYRSTHRQFTASFLCGGGIASSLIKGLKMESNIKDELYSDIFDMSNLQSSLRLTTNSGNNDSHGMNFS